MANRTVWTLSQERFGKVAEFTMSVLDDGGYAFHVTAPSWYHGNLAAEWINRQMNEIRQTADCGLREHSYPKWCRCHSKKRLKKLWMSLGHSRRSADALCFLSRNAGMSYQEEWERVIFEHPYHRLQCEIKDPSPADNPETGSE